MPRFLDMPCEGVITQLYGGGHGGVDIAASLPVPVYAPAPGWAERHYPGDGFGDGSFGNHVVIHHEDGWYSLVAHMEAHALTADGPVEAGTRLGLMGYTGYTIPAGPGGRHVHWAMCQQRLFPRWSLETAGLFGDPMAHLIPDGERAMLFAKLERIEQFLGGEARLAAWVSAGNIPLLDCLGQQPALLAEVTAKWPGIEAQTYGTNNLLHQWRAALATQGITVP